MSFARAGEQFSRPRWPARLRPRALLATGVRLLLAAVATATALAIGSAALYVTTAPAWVSLLVEPFSLLLLPGLIVALALDGGHDFLNEHVIAAAGMFWLFVFLRWPPWAMARSWRARLRGWREV